MIQFIDDCNGCDTCTGCGRCKERRAVFCDFCHQEIEDEVYFLDTLELCEDCLSSAVSHMNADAFLEV